MTRTRITGALVAALGALVGCGGDSVCHLSQCGEACIDVSADPENCGGCGITCGEGSACVANACVAEGCVLPEVGCGSACVDTDTDDANCGACGVACTANGSGCMTGRCAEPLVAMQTSKDDRTVDRDLWVVQDVTLNLTQLDSATFATSRVIDHVVLPDGRVVFVASEDTEGTFELYLASPQGGPPTKLNPTLVTGGNVQAGLTVSADGSTLLYRADQDVDDEIDLYAVNLASPGVTVKVNGALAVGARVSRVVALSADGSRAAYVADQDTQGLDEAYTVDLTTATPGPSTKLNPTVPRSIWDLQMSADGTRVVYRADQDTLGLPQLYLVELATAGTSTFIDNTAEPTYHADDVYRFDATGTALYYVGSANTFEDSLWRVPLATTPIDSDLLVSGAGGIPELVASDIVVARDGQHVFYRRRSNDIARVFVVDVGDPTTPTLLSDPSTDATSAASDFALSPDQTQLVYRGGGDGAEGGTQTPGTLDPGTFEGGGEPTLFHVDVVAGTAPVQLATTATNEGFHDGYLALDDGRAVFRADLDVAGQTDAYLVDAAVPTELTKISPPLAAGSEVTDVSVLSRF